MNNARELGQGLSELSNVQNAVWNDWEEAQDAGNERAANKAIATFAVEENKQTATKW